VGYVELGRLPVNDDITTATYDELRRLAATYMRRERAGHTLQPSALVHEAFMRMEKQGTSVTGRPAFFGVAARLMRQILVDHARVHSAAKRQGGRLRMTLAEDVVATAGEPAIDILDLHTALEALAERDERKSRVVELRFFGGLTIHQVAETLGISRTTAEEDWYMARAWLRHRLQGT
jgi:RNA polymerase sigma-70 factor (ECF subfamily)